MKQIDISTPKYPNTFSLVDDADFEWLNQWKWGLTEGEQVNYVTRSTNRRTLYMHREILKVPSGVMVDHRDSNGLNNQRYNLRPATNAENQANNRLRKDNTSGYKGVHWHKHCNKWRASIKVNGKTLGLGFYFCIIKAAKAYDVAARKHRGEYARTNFPIWEKHNGNTKAKSIYSV